MKAACWVGKVPYFIDLILYVMRKLTYTSSAYFGERCSVMEDELKPLLSKRLNFVLLQITILSLATGLLGSCSWVTNRESLFGDNPKVKEEEIKAAKKKRAEAYARQGKSAEVPREQYEQLKSKYQALLKGEHESGAQEKYHQEGQTTDMEDPARLVEQLRTSKSGAADQGELAETVDVFGRDGIVKKSETSGHGIFLEDYEKDFVSDSIESEIIKLRKADSLIRQNKFSEGLNLLKDVEHSTSRQIRVRSKFLLGEILFKQKEYDLAMQIFEEIISKDAFSGVVLKTLGRLIICSEKLKQEKKQQQYYSILHDFFESGV